MLEQAYQILYFAPDLVAGERFAVGAFVRDFDRHRFVPAKRRLGPACLGGVRPASLLDVLLDRAVSLQAGDQAEVQRALGQNIELSQEVVLRQRVEDLAKWVRDHVLPAADEKEHEKRASPIRRDSAGMGFFRQRQVADLVQCRFQPDKVWGEKLQTKVRSGLCATHWVNGGDRVLMLEPVLMRHDGVSARGVHTQILALQRYMERAAATTSGIGAYILTGGPTYARQDAVSLMKDATDLVFDLADPLQADQLTDRIRKTAALAGLGLTTAN